MQSENSEAVRKGIATEKVKGNQYILKIEKIQDIIIKYAIITW